MYIFKPQRHLLVKNIREVSHYFSGKTLDIGAGEYNRYGKFFPSASYTRMDLEARMGVDVVGSIYEIPFPDNSFDSVICTQVFEHLAYPSKAVEEIWRVLKPGGKALITVPQTSPLHEIPHDYYRYTKYGLLALFNEFELVEMRQLGGFYTQLADTRICFWCDTWNLHHRPILGRIAGKLINWYGRFMVWRDTNTEASLLHAIGWVAVFKKKELL